MEDGSIWVYPCGVRITVRVSRDVAGVSQGLFTFAGTIAPPTLRAVMQVVRRLTDAVPGSWRIDVMATDLDGPLLAYVESVLQELHREGRPARLAHLPRRRPRVPSYASPSTWIH